MVRTMSMTRCQNNTIDASSRKRKKTCEDGGRKRKKTCEDGGGVAWSDLNHDVLHSVMMQLGVVEFISFSGVCKSWRSLALSNKKKFMSSKPPMLMTVSSRADKKTKTTTSPCADKNTITCHLQDFEGRKFKTIIPRSAGRKFAGLASGYLILYGEKPRDIWLVNPLTRHQLHFHNVPFHVDLPREKGGVGAGVRAVLVFSPLVNGWVFVIMNRYTDEMWFCMLEKGKGVWNHVTYDYCILDVHAFKGRIYTLHFCGSPIGERHICELTFDPVPKLTVLDMHFLEPLIVTDFVSSDENLYLMEYTSMDTYKVHKLGFDDMTWVPCEKTVQEYYLFNSNLKYSAALKPDSWAASTSGRFFDAKRRGESRLYLARMWYFPHDCFISKSHR